MLEPVGYEGNVGRDSLIGPGLLDLDYSLVKDTSVKWLGEAGKVEFRAEFFNILNHPNFAQPTGTSVFSGALTDGANARSRVPCGYGKPGDGSWRDYFHCDGNHGHASQREFATDSVRPENRVLIVHARWNGGHRIVVALTTLLVVNIGKVTCNGLGGVGCVGTKSAFAVASLVIAGVMGLISARAYAQSSKAASQSASTAADKPYDWKASFAQVKVGKVPRMPDGKPESGGHLEFQHPDAA